MKEKLFNICDNDITRIKQNSINPPHSSLGLAASDGAKQQSADRFKWIGNFELTKLNQGGY